MEEDQRPQKEGCEACREVRSEINPILDALWELAKGYINQRRWDKLDFLSTYLEVAMLELESRKAWGKFLTMEN